MRTVPEVAEAYSHVVVDRVGNGDGDAEAHDAVGDAESVDVSILKEEEASEDSPDQGNGSEDGIGDMRDGEDSGCGDDRGSFARQQTQKAEQEIALQDELLHERPDDVGPTVLEDGCGTVEWMQRVVPTRYEDGNG